MCLCIGESEIGNVDVVIREDLDSDSGSLYKGWVNGYMTMSLIDIGVMDCGGTLRLREQSRVFRELMSYW